jgi:RNA-binding motif X-linked protein 2
LYSYSVHEKLLIEFVNSVVKEINRINQKELDLGLSGASWHDEYKDSAYVFAGGLSTDLTEGDVITIFSQWVHSSLYLLII